MNKAVVFTWISLVLSLACFVLLWFDLRMPAAVSGFLGFTLAHMAISKGSSKTIVLISLFAALAFGLAISWKTGYFYETAALFTLAFMMGARLLFLEQLNYTRAAWLEPSLFVAGLAFYILGNIYEANGWVGWTFPAPTVAYAGFMILGQTVTHKDLKANAIERFGVEIGKPAPDISLPDEDGTLVALSDFKGKRHVLLIFVRGDWCPTCHIMLRAYEKNKERFAAKNIMLLAIGPDDISVNKEMVNKLGLDYKLLSDNKMEAVKVYGMQLQGNNPMTKYAEGIPLPASFLVDINGNVLYTSNPRMAGEILNPETIIPIVDKLQATA